MSDLHALTYEILFIFSILYTDQTIDVVHDFQHYLLNNHKPTI